MAQAAAEDIVRELETAKSAAEARAEADGARCGAIQHALESAIEVQDSLRQEVKTAKSQTYYELRLEVEAETWASVEKQMQHDATQRAKFTNMRGQPVQYTAIAVQLQEELAALGFDAGEAHVAVKNVLSLGKAGDLESFLHAAIDQLLSTKQQTVEAGTKPLRVI